MANNMLVDQGMNTILNRAYKGTPDYTVISQFSIGTGETAVTSSDTAMEEPLPFTNEVTLDACDADTGWVSAGQAATETVNNTTYREGTGSLNLGKTGTAATEFTYTKTIGAAKDLTACYAYVLLYVADATTLGELDISTGAKCLIKLGDDSSNYYSFYFATKLKVGWNTIFCDPANADASTGSPDVTAIDYLQILMNTDNNADVIALGDLIMDYWVYAASTECFKAIDASYPVFDTTNIEIEYRGIVLSTEGLYFDISAFGSFNSDGTKRMDVHATHADVVKDSSTEIVYIVKNRLRRTV